MDLRIDVVVDYSLAAPGAAILLLEAAGARGQTIRDAHVEFDSVGRFGRVPAEEGIGERIVLRVADRLSCRYGATVSVERPRPDLSALEAVPMEAMPGDALRYTLSSRYCVAERFAPFVERTFGGLSGGPRVAAMRDWVEGNLTYASGTSDATTTAVDTFLDRKGICRDYAHLMIAMCRASMIPARIASVYAPHVTPPDFHAVAEVYLDGGWHLVDATGMAAADQIAMIAVGRDATDVAFLTTISPAKLERQEVAVSIAGESGQGSGKGAASGGVPPEAPKA